MLIKILGIADVIAVLVLLLSSLIPSEFVLLMGVYLLAKGGFFLLTGDWLSSLDVGAAVYFMFAANGVTNVIVTTLVVLFLLQKSVFSLLV